MDTLFFIASKLVGALIRVDTWIVLAFAVIACALWFGRTALARRVATASLIVVLLITVLPVGDVLLRPIEATHPQSPKLTKVDGIIVLGGGEDGGASAYWGEPQVNAGGERFLTAIALTRLYPEARIVFAGGSGRLRDAFEIEETEASFAAQIFAAHGIGPPRLVLEAASRNTAENAQLSHALVGPTPDQTWVLITSAFHMPRAVRSFAAAGWPPVVPYPVDHRTQSFADGMGWRLNRNISHINLAIKERVGQVAYGLTGR